MAFTHVPEAPCRPQELAAWVEAGLLSPPEAIRRLRLGSPGPVPVRGPRRRAAAPEAPGGPARLRGAVPRPDPALDRQQRVAAVMAELEGLVGLAPVKRVIREVHAFVQVQQWRSAAILPAEPVTLHMVFTGNPGTGKTTVARVLGQLYQAMGVLPKGHLVEVDRADLVGEYIGHTAQRTREVVRGALGGVLFVDEAYALARGGEKDFGKEAIDQLVKAMEDHRHELAVILAGYPVEMEWFLLQNPGLRSRLPLVIDFPDYTAEELVCIGERMLAQRQYRLAGDAAALLRDLVSRESWRFAAEAGNARAVRNLLERAIRCQALRLVAGTGPGAAPPAGAAPSEVLPGREELILVARADLEAALA